MLFSEISEAVGVGIMQSSSALTECSMMYPQPYPIRIFLIFLFDLIKNLSAWMLVEVPEWGPTALKDFVFIRMLHLTFNCYFQMQPFRAIFGQGRGCCTVVNIVIVEHILSEVSALTQSSGDELLKDVVDRRLRCTDKDEVNTLFLLFS